MVGDMPDSTLYYTFIYEKSDRAEVIITLETLGFVVNHDREVVLEQVPAGEGLTDAKAGVHYVAFDDPSMKGKFTLKANQTKIDIPITFIKTADMENQRFYLRLKVKKNEHFEASFNTHAARTIEVSNIVVEPKEWDEQRFLWAGDYGPVKYRFMLDNSDFISEEWWEKNFTEANITYGKYIARYFTDKLILHNAERKANNKGPLSEKLENGDDGAPVQFDGLDYE